MKLLFSVLLASNLPGTIVAVSDRPSEESALAALEKALQDDPRTVEFEKTGEWEYHYKTTWFPYNGKLRIINLVLDDDGLSEMYEATFDFEFDKDAEVRERYEGGHFEWLREYRRLYYDSATKQWIDMYEAMDIAQSSYDAEANKPFYEFWEWYGWLLVLLAILAPALLIMIVQNVKMIRSLRQIHEQLKQG